MQPMAESPICKLVDLERYPLEDPDDPRTRAVIAAARADWQDCGAFNLEGFMHPAALARAVAEIEPLMARESFHHTKSHNIWFNENEPVPARLEAAKRRLETSHHTLCSDQLAGTIIRRIYEWDALPAFLAAVMDKPALYRMADPLACLNVMGYGPGDGIAWHFDRAEFAVSLLLQAAEAGGEFQYRRGLRSPEDPNYAGVARLLAGDDPEVRTASVAAGTLSVFAGYGTPHRVTPVEGRCTRLIAILSYMEEPGVRFAPADRRQFYGRTDPLGGEAG